jgi:hypothetical protein
MAQINRLRLRRLEDYDSGHCFEFRASNFVFIFIVYTHSLIQNQYLSGPAFRGPFRVGFSLTGRAAGWYKMTTVKQNNRKIQG